ncbi:hypothetical protein GCM10023091_24310 [Ravibacter arvi]|uniref:Imelysin-like domain-containing protein n=1 Tax=Ravibacter arvi TaxID=2051041 RepID=A0ABP8LZU5_9BACT
MEPISISDRRKALAAIGYNVITPSYVDFQNSVNGLIAETAAFADNTTDHRKLNRLKEVWLQCAISWKRISLFESNPANSQFIFDGIYGTPDTLEVKKILNNIEQNIDSSYIQGLNPNCKGIQTYEYLLFGQSKGDNATILELFADEIHGRRRSDYLLSLSKSLKYYADRGIYKWSAGGEDYVNKFIQADGAGSDGSISVLVNQMERHISLIKSERVGRPLGINNGGQPQVNALDGKWSNKCAELLLGEMDAILAVYLGHKVGSVNYTGLNLLVNIVSANSNNPSLSSEIENHIDSVYSKTLSISTPFDRALFSDRESVNELYQELETLEGLIKNDMKQALGL